MSRRCIRARGWVAVFSALLVVACAPGAWQMWNQGECWLSLVLAGLALVGGLGVVDGLTSRLCDAGDSILLVNNFRRVLLPKPEIRSVGWEKGSGAWIEMKDGTIHRLSQTLPNAQGVVNSLRAWLKSG